MSPTAPHATAAFTQHFAHSMLSAYHLLMETIAPETWVSVSPLYQRRRRSRKAEHAAMNTPSGLGAAAADTCHALPVTKRLVPGSGP